MKGVRNWSSRLHLDPENPRTSHFEHHVLNSPNHRSLPTMIVARQYHVRPYILSLLAVSTLSSKALHLSQHATSLPLTKFILYFPTFFIQDFLLLIGAWFLLHRSTGLRSLSILGLFIIAIITSVSSYNQTIACSIELTESLS